LGVGIVNDTARSAELIAALYARASRERHRDRAERTCARAKIPAGCGTGETRAPLIGLEVIRRRGLAPTDPHRSADRSTWPIGVPPQGAVYESRFPTCSVGHRRYTTRARRAQFRGGVRMIHTADPWTSVRGVACIDGRRCRRPRWKHTRPGKARSRNGFALLLSRRADGDSGVDIGYRTRLRKIRGAPRPR